MMLTTHKPIRAMNVGDINAIVEMSERYFAESDHGDFMEFSANKVRQRCRTSLDVNTIQFIVYAPFDKVQGFAQLSLADYYSKEPVGTILTLYLEPDYRKGPAAKLLLDQTEETARELGCTAVYFGAHAGIEKYNKTLPNMMKKRGYAPLWSGRKTLKGE